jgi:hypothetical protein
MRSPVLLFAVTNSLLLTQWEVSALSSPARRQLTPRLTLLMMQRKHHLMLPLDHDWFLDSWFLPQSPCCKGPNYRFSVKNSKTLWPLIAKKTIENTNKPKPSFNYLLLRHYNFSDVTSSGAILLVPVFSWYL